MGVTAFRFVNKYGQRCDKCQKVAHQLYKVRIGEFDYKFCSGMHAQIAASEYSNKVSKGITPGNIRFEDDDEGEDLFETGNSDTGNLNYGSR